MRITRCPHCGADNSVKRTACYQCQQPLTPAPEPADPAAPAAAADPAPSRWQALDLPGRHPSRRPLRPAAEQFPQPSAPAPPRPRPTTYMPTFRRPLRHVRRMGVFFRELHTLTRSGIAIAAACRELSRRAPAGLRPLAADMADAADRGGPIHSVMATHPDLFYPWHIGLVQAAQAGGYLPEALDQIAHAYEIEWETRSALLSRLFFYLVFALPLILLVLPLLLMLRQPFPQGEVAPDYFLRLALGFLRTVSLPIAIALLALFLIWQALAATAWFQRVQQRAVLFLPIASRVARAAALDRYLATLGLLLRGGIPVAEAAEQAAHAAGNAALTPRLLAVAQAVREGLPLAQALAATGAFDRDTLSIAATGEVAGALPDMLARAAGYYRQEHELKRRLLLRLATISLGALWAVSVAVLVVLGARAYFDFMFRGLDWLLQG